MKIKHLVLLTLSGLLMGCGATFTLGFMGATASVTFPMPEKIKPEMSAMVTTQPTTQGAKP